MHRLFLFIFLGSLTVGTRSQSVDTLMHDVLQFQTEKNTFYASGLVPTQRKQTFVWREDDNIFFTASTLYILQSLSPYFNDYQNSILNAFESKATQNYPNYCQKEWDYTCNFWVPAPHRHFPNSLYSKFKRFAIPDDFDDTSLLLSTGDFTKKQQQLTAQKLLMHRNWPDIQIKSTFKRYRHFEAYSTWVGKNMPVDFDICVHANILAMKFNNEMPLNRADTITLDLIESILNNEDHLKHPQIVAPHYQKSEVIIYHLARLVQADPLNLTRDIKPYVAMGIQALRKEKKSNWKQLLLHNAGLMIGLKPCSDFDFQQLKPGKLRFFVANFTSVNRLWLRRLTEPLGITEAPYRCRAFEQALILEAKVLHEAHCKQNF